MSISDLDDSDLEFASADEGTSLSSESDNEVVTAKKATKNDTKVEASKSDSTDSKKENNESQNLEVSDKNKQDKSENIVEKVADKTSDLNIVHEPKQETKEPRDETTVKDEFQNKKVETESVDLKNDEPNNTTTTVAAAAVTTNESLPIIEKNIEKEVKKLDEKGSNVKLEEKKNESKQNATATEQAKTAASSKTLKKLDEFSDLSESDDENDKSKHKKGQHSDSKDSDSEADDTNRKNKKVIEAKKSDNSPATVETTLDEPKEKMVETKLVTEVKSEKSENIEETNKEMPNQIDQPLEVKKEESIKTEDISVATKKEENVASNAGSGWNDTEFSDIDDNDDENEDEKDLTIEKTSTIDKSSASSNNNNNNKDKQKEISQINKNKEEDDSFWKENLTYENVKKQEPTQSQAKFQQQQQQDSQQNSWSWSKFGTSLFSTATTFTSQLADGLNSVIGAPDPLELALKNKKEKEEFEETEEKRENEQDNDTKDAKEWADSFNDNSSDWFSAIPINKITNTLVTGSLDVLETVGKKTIEIINDKDPNFKQTKELIKKAAVPAKPNLSQLLREAQLESEKQSTNTNLSSSQSSSSSYTYARKIEPSPNKQQTFSSYFEDFKGSSYLEALEMLSRQYNVKLEMLNINERKMNQLKPLNVIFNLDDLLNEDDDVDSEEFDFENFEDLIIDYMSEVSVKVQASVDRVIQSFKTASETTKQTLTVNELFNESVKCFALTTSTLIELYHKVAETLLIQQQNDKDSLTMVINKAEHLCQITKLCTRSTTMIANDFCRRIKSTQDKATLSSQTIANIYLEASNSNTYIGDSFILLSPIFKCLTLEEMEK